MQITQERSLRRQNVRQRIFRSTRFVCQPYSPALSFTEGSRTCSICEDVPASTASVSRLPHLLNERTYDSTQASRPPFCSFKNKAAAEVRRACLRQYEHGSRRDSQISTELESIVGAVTSSLDADEKEAAESTPGNSFVYKENDAPGRSFRVPAPPSMQPYNGACRDCVRKSNYRNSQKIPAPSDGAASPHTLLLWCPADSASRRSRAETSGAREAREVVRRGTCRQRQHTQQHPGPRKEQNMRRLEKQPHVRERLLQRRRSGMRRCRVNGTEMSFRSAGKECSRKGPPREARATGFIEDTVPRVFLVSSAAAAHAHTIEKTFVSSTAVAATEQNSRRDVTEAPGCREIAGETTRVALKVSGRKDRVSPYTLAREGNSGNDSCALPVVAASQHGPANMPTAPSGPTVDTHENTRGDRALSTPSRETTFFSSLVSSTLCNSFLSMSSSVPHYAGRISRLRPLQPRPTVSPRTLDALSLPRPATSGGDVCDTLLPVTPAVMCSSRASAPFERVPRTVAASASRCSPCLHQLPSVEQLPLFRKLVAEAEHAHRERRQQKLQINRQQQQQHAQLRQLLEQYARQRSTTSSLHEKDSELGGVSDFSSVKNERRVPQRNRKSRAGVDRRRRICVAAVAARTPTSTLTHLIHVRAASRAAAEEGQPKNGRACVLRSSTNSKEFKSSSSRTTSRDSASNRSNSRTKHCLRRQVKQRFRKKKPENPPVNGSSAASHTTPAETPAGCRRSCSKQRDLGRSVNSAVSATSGIRTLEAGGFEDRSTMLTRAAHDACVLQRKVGDEPCFYSWSPASSVRRHHPPPAASYKARWFHSQSCPRSASRFTPVSVDATHVSSSASASISADHVLTEVPRGVAAAADMRTGSARLTAAAVSSPAGVSYKTAVAAGLSETASSVSTNCLEENILPTRGGGAAYVHLSSNDSRSADTAWGGSNRELLGSCQVAKHENEESQQLLSVALCGNAAFTETLGISCPRERYWELYNAYQRRAACGDSPLRRLHKLQQQQEQQQMQRQRRRHIEQKGLEGCSALLKEGTLVFSVRAGERNMCEGENSASGVYTADRASKHSLPPPAFLKRQWRNRYIEQPAGAAVQRKTHAAAGLAREAALCSATEAEENADPPPGVATGSAGIPALPFQRASWSAAARPAPATRLPTQRSTCAETESVGAFQRTHRIHSFAVTPSEGEPPLPDTAPAKRGREQKRVDSLKKKEQQRAGHEQLLQYFRHQLLAHFQQHPPQHEVARGRDRELPRADFPDSYVGVNLARGDRQEVKKREAVRRSGKTGKPERSWTASSRDVLAPPADASVLQSHNSPSPLMRLQLYCRRKAAAGRRAGIDAADGAARFDVGAAVDGSPSKRLILNNAATLHSTCGAAVPAAAAPDGADATEQRGMSPSAACEDVVSRLTSTAAPLTVPESPLRLPPPRFLSYEKPYGAATAAAPAVPHISGARAHSAGQLNVATTGTSPSTVASFSPSVGAFLIHPVRAAVAASSAGDKWPAVGTAWPKGDPTATTTSSSPLRLTDKSAHRGIGMAARVQAVGRQQRTLHANDKIHASSVSVISSRDTDRASSCCRSTIAADIFADTVRASACGRGCKSLSPFATSSVSRTAGATDFDAHIAREVRGINGKRNKGFCTGSRSNPGSRSTNNRNSDNENSSSRTRTSSVGHGEHFKITRSSDRGRKGQSRGDKGYFLLSSDDDGRPENNVVSVVASHKSLESSFSHFGAEAHSEEKRSVLVSHRVTAAEAAATTDGKEAAGGLILTSAGEPLYTHASSQNRAAAPRTADSRCECFQGAQAEKKPPTDIQTSCWSCRCPHIAENSSDRGPLAECGLTPLHLQGSSKGRCPVATCCVAGTEGGAYELRGALWSARAIHAADAQAVHVGACTAAAETGSSAAGALPAAAVSAGAEPHPFAPSSCPLRATAFSVAATRAKAGAPAVAAANSTNATRTAVVAASPGVVTAAKAAPRVAAADIPARTIPTAIGLKMPSAARAATVAKTVSSVSGAAPTTTVHRGAATPEATGYAPGPVGGNNEAATVVGSSQQALAECSKSGVSSETSNRRSRDRGDVHEYEYKNGRYKDGTRDNKRSSEDQAQKGTQAGHKAADTCRDYSMRAATAHGMTVPTANGAAAFSNCSECTSSFRDDHSPATYPGLGETHAFPDANSVSPPPVPVGGGVDAAAIGAVAFAEIPRDKRPAANAGILLRGHPLPGEAQPARKAATADASNPTYSSGMPHGKSRQLLASDASMREMPSEARAAASAVPSCKDVQSVSPALAVSCLATAVTAHPASLSSPESRASSLGSVLYASQHPQKQQMQPPKQQPCFGRRPPPHQYPQQQAQQQHQLHEQSRLQQQYTGQQPQPQQHPQQHLQQQAAQHQAQERQLQQQLQSLQQPSQVQDLGLQRSPSPQPHQGWRASEQLEQERIQLRQAQQQQHGNQQEQQAREEVYHPVVMRAALAESLTATQMSTSLFMWSNCSSTSEESPESLTTAAATPSTESPMPRYPSAPARPYSKQLTGAAAPGSSAVATGVGGVSACSAGLAAAESSPANAGPLAADVTSVTASKKEKGLADCNLTCSSFTGCRKGCTPIEQQQQQTAKGAARDLGDDAAVLSASSTRKITAPAAAKRAAAFPTKAAEVTAEIPHLASTSAAKVGAERISRIHNEDERSFAAVDRRDAEPPPAGNDDRSRVANSLSLASLPSLDGSCSTEEAQLTQLLTQLLLFLQKQPRTSSDAPLFATAEGEAQEQHLAKRGTAAGTAGAALTGTAAVAAAGTAAAVAGGQLPRSSSAQPCKTTRHACHLAASTSAGCVEGASLPTGCGDSLAGTVAGSSKRNRCLVESNSGHTGLQNPNIDNAFAAVMRNNTESCSFAAAGDSSSSDSSNSVAFGSCSTGLAAVHMRPSSPPPRPGSAVVSDVTAAVVPAAAATRPAADAAPCSTATGNRFTAAPTGPSSAAAAALNAATAVAAIRVGRQLEFRSASEMAGERSVAMAPTPLLPPAIGGTEVGTDRVMPALASSTLLSEEAGRQSTALRINNPGAGTAARAQLQKAPHVISFCSDSCSNISSITQGLAGQQPFPSPPTLRECGHVSVFEEAFAESRGRRKAATATAAGTATEGCAGVAAPVSGDAAREGSGLLAARGTTAAAVPEPVRLSRTRTASRDGSTEKSAGADRSGCNCSGSAPADRSRAAYAAAGADALGDQGAVNLTVSPTASTAERDVLTGAAGAYLGSCKQTHTLRPLLLASLLGMLSLDDSMLLPLLPASQRNERCLDCTGTSQGSTRSCNGTVVTACTQNSHSGSSSSSSRSGSSADDLHGGRCVHGSTPLSMLVSAASAGVATAGAGDWTMTLPRDLQQAAALSISLLRQLSTSTQLSYSASPFASLQLHRQQQLQQPCGLDSLPIRQQLRPLQSQNQLAMVADCSHGERQEQSRQQPQLSQHVGEHQGDSEGFIKLANQQQNVAREVFDSTSVRQKLQLAAPFNVAAATRTPVTASPGGAAVHGDGPEAAVASCTLSPGAPAATAASDVNNTPAFSAVVGPSHYSSPGGGRSLSLSQLQQTSTAGSVSPQEWEEHQMQPQQQLQLEQHQLQPEREVLAQPPETQQCRREGRPPSNCAVGPRSCSPTLAGTGTKQFSEEQRRSFAHTRLPLHAQQLGKLQQEQQQRQSDQGTQKVDRVESGASPQMVNVASSVQEERHLVAPQHSVKRQHEAYAVRQQKGPQQHLQQRCGRRQGQVAQLLSLQRPSLVPQQPGHLLSETEAIRAQTKVADNWNDDHPSCDSNVAQKVSQQRAAERVKNTRSNRTKSSRDDSSMERTSCRRQCSKAHKHRSTQDRSKREHRSTRNSGRRESSSRGDTSSRSTRRRRSDSTVQQVSSRSRLTTTKIEKCWDNQAAPAGRRGRTGCRVDEDSARRKRAAVPASVRNTDYVVETDATATGKAALLLGESAGQRTHTAADVGTRLPAPVHAASACCETVVAAAADPRPSSRSDLSAHRTDDQLENKRALKKIKEEKNSKKNRLREQYKKADFDKADTLRVSDMAIAAAAFLVQKSFTTSGVTAADTADAVAQRRLPQVARLYYKANEEHSQRALNQQQLQRCQGGTCPNSHHSLSPCPHAEQGGKETKRNASKKARSCSGGSKSRGVYRENMSTPAAGHGLAMHLCSKEARSDIRGDNNPMECDSSTSRNRRSSSRRDSNIKSRSSSTQVLRRTGYSSRSSSDHKRSDGHSKRNSNSEHRSSSRHLLNSSDVQRSRGRRMSSTRTRRVRPKKRVASTSTNPWGGDAEEQVLPMLRKHLQQQRELQEELQQVEHQLAGLHLLNSLTAVSAGVSSPAATRMPAQMNAASEGRTAHDHKHRAEPRRRREDNASNSYDGDKRMCDSSICEVNSRSSGSSSERTSYYTPVSVSTVSAAAVRRGEGTGASRIGQIRSLNSNQFVAAEEAAVDACVFRSCARVLPIAEARHVTIRSTTKSSSRSARSSRSDSCESIMGKELLEFSGGKVGLAAVKQQLRGTCSSPFYAAAGADSTASFSWKLPLQGPMCAGQANTVESESRAKFAHSGARDAQTAAATGEKQRKREVSFQGLRSVERQQQWFRSGDALQRRSVNCPAFRSEKEDVLLLSAADRSEDEAKRALGNELTHRREHCNETTRQRLSSRGDRVWLDYRSAANITGAPTSRGANQHQNQQRRLQQSKRPRRNLQTSMLLDSETDGPTEISVSEKDQRTASYR